MTNVEINDLILNRFSHNIRDIIYNRIESINIRKSVLSMLGDRCMYLDIKKLLDGDISQRVGSIYEIYDFLNKYHTISEYDKKRYCEVQTPKELVIDMLSKLPESVWENPNLKWLDSSSGMGNFALHIIVKLMSGLSVWEPDLEKRYKHIVENMIYVVDIQPINIFLYTCILDIENKYKLNYYCGDFLSRKFKKFSQDEWSLCGFDVVVGNPPYNNSGKANNKSSVRALWDSFVFENINILKDGGYLCVVHPSIWRKPQNENSYTKKIGDLLRSKQILYLEMHGIDDGVKTFGTRTRYDFYVLENKPTYSNTKICDEKGNICEMDIRNLNFIPNYDIYMYEKLFSNTDKLEVIFNSSYHTKKKCVSSKKCKYYKYPLIHSTPKSGVRVMYSTINDIGHFGVPKVIFGETGIGSVVVDMDGKYGMTQGAIGIKVSSVEEAYKIKTALMCDSFKKYIKTVMWSNYRIDNILVSYLKKDFWKEFI